jgi:hypothetical protein
MAHTIMFIMDTIAFILSWVLYLLVFLIFLALFLSPLVLLVMVTARMVKMIMTIHAFLRDFMLQKPPTQIDRQDLPKPLTHIIVRNTESGNAECKGKERSTSHQDVDTFVDRTNGELGLAIEPDNDKIYSRDNHDFQEPAIYPRNTFIGLPVELRLIIYEFALQDNFDSIIPEPSSPSASSELDILRSSAILQPLPFLGGLALNHTSQTIRKESLASFSPLLSAQFRATL